MKIFNTLFVVAIAAVGLSACNENDVEDRADTNRTLQRVQQDEAPIQRSEAELARDRQAKADAKARGDLATSAGKSVEIGADKAAASSSSAYTVTVSFSFGRAKSRVSKVQACSIATSLK